MTTSKLSTPNKAPSRLERFAHEHELVVARMRARNLRWSREWARRDAVLTRASSGGKTRSGIQYL